MNHGGTLRSRAHLGRLACSQGAQPYVVPCYFACDNKFMYSFSTVGKKIEGMRANPLVRVEADEVVNSQNWRSVIVLGRCLLSAGLRDFLSATTDLKIKPIPFDAEYRGK